MQITIRVQNKAMARELVREFTDDPAMCVSAIMLRGMLKLSKAEQVRIALLGSDVAFKQANQLATDVVQAETVHQLATAPKSLS